MPAKVTRARHQGYLLHEPADRYPKPSSAGVSHIRGDYTSRNFALMGVTPQDTPRTDAGAKFDEALAGEEIEIELESILKAGSGSRTGHRCLTQFHQRLVSATEIVACLGAGTDVRANGDAPVELAAT
jgi:hypothetical protein